MGTRRSPGEIAQALLGAFPEENKRPAPAEVEQIMRPLGLVSTQVGLAVESILHAQGKGDLASCVSNWVEANVVTSSEEPDCARRIAFLLMDTCTCVLDYLPKAIEHAPGPVDPRILNLLNHKHFHKSS